MKKVLLILLFLTFPALCFAGPPIAFEGSISAIYNNADALGFDDGFGIDGTVEARCMDFSLFAQAWGTLEEKFSASDGYRYYYAGDLRYYVLGSKFFIGAGAWKRGYRSEFGDGDVWKKFGYGDKYSVGFSHELIDITATYAPRESVTDNEIEWAEIRFQFAIYKNLIATLASRHTRFDTAPGESRRRGISETIGIGWKF